MKKYDLMKFIESGKMNKTLFDELKNEVLSYIDNTTSGKGSVYIYGDNETEEQFDRHYLITLLQYYLNNIILEWELEYILNYLEFSFEITDEKVEEVIFNFSDPYLNYPINTENVKKAIYFLCNKSKELKLKSQSGKELRPKYKTLFT